MSQDVQDNSKRRVWVKTLAIPLLSICLIGCPIPEHDLRFFQSGKTVKQMQVDIPTIHGYIKLTGYTQFRTLEQDEISLTLRCVLTTNIDPPLVKIVPTKVKCWCGGNQLVRHGPDLPRQSDTANSNVEFNSFYYLSSEVVFGDTAKIGHDSRFPVTFLLDSVIWNNGVVVELDTIRAIAEWKGL